MKCEEEIYQLVAAAILCVHWKMGIHEALTLAQQVDITFSTYLNLVHHMTLIQEDVKI